MVTHLPKKDRKIQILAAAVKLAENPKTGPYNELTRDQIAEAAGVSPATVSHVMGTMDAVKKAILRKAIATDNATIVAQGLLAKDPLAKKAPELLHARAAKLAAELLLTR